MAIDHLNASGYSQLSQTHWRQSSDILSDISFDILSDISSDILSNILSGISPNILCRG